MGINIVVVVVVILMLSFEYSIIRISFYYKKIHFLIFHLAGIICNSHSKHLNLYTSSNIRNVFIQLLK